MKSALSLTIVLVAVSAVPLAAQQREADAAWSRLGRLPEGAEIVVTLKSEPPVRGQFFSGDESTIRILNRAQGVDDFARSDVTEIKMLLPHSTGRDAFTGFVVGSVAYGLIAGSLCRAFGGTGSCAGDIAKAAAGGGGFTAGISIGTGAIKHRVKPTRVVYRAP